MRTQTFGVEIEMTSITRQVAADVAAEFFGTTSTHIGGGYDKYAATDTSGRLCASYPMALSTYRARTAIERRRLRW